MQTPLATQDAEQQGQQIETEVQRLATTASPATLASWSSRLDHMTHALNAAEKAATGVDPTAPPQGWSEPANFQAARGLLTSLKSTVAQAQAAQGVAPALAQPAQAASPAQALAAITPKFMAPQPTGQATAKLLGQPAAAEAGKATATAQAQAQTQTQTQTPASGSAASVRAAPAQAATASPQAVAQATGAAAGAKTGPTPAPSHTVALSVKPEAAPETPTGRAGAATPAPAASAPAAQPGAAAKQSAPVPATTDQAAADAAAQAGQAAANGQGDTLAAAQASAASASAAGAGTAAQAAAAAADPTRAAPAAVAYLAAAIVKQGGGKSTSFNIELHPADLGRVDVKLQIQSDGQLAARMSFDNPAAAASFQAHADDLRRSLEQAGFQLSNDSLSFSGRDAQTANGGSDGFSGQTGSGRSGAGSRAFAGVQASTSTAEAAAAPQNLQAVGLDMRI